MVAPTSRHRRGVLLLVVLSLLVVFLLIAVTFVVVANQQRQAAKAASRMNQTGTDPRELADGALMQLLRDVDLGGNNRPQSAIFGHSLLEDLYGRLDTFSGIIGRAEYPGESVSPPLGTTGGQFVDLHMSLSSQPFTQPDGIVFQPKPIKGYYNGCVLTITSGSLRDASARIVAYSFDSDNNTVKLTVSFLPDLNRLPIDTSRLAESRFLVNTRPFSGKGIGYNPATGMLDLKDGSSGNHRERREFALMPNWTGHDFRVGLDHMLTVQAQLGGANESYDAPDYQNVFLALEEPARTHPDQLRSVIPSFHRPALVNYWMARESAASLLDFANDGTTNRSENRDLLRRILFRPNPVDHPNFPGNQSGGWDPFRGPWDVDNNGDGEYDSVWIDLGYPAVRTHGGQTYKPLFAILCMDLDGRFNLNAHGNILQLDPLPPPHPSVSYVQLAGGGTSELRPRGEGYGPGEIHMGPGFGDLFPLLPERIGGGLYNHYQTRFSQLKYLYRSNPDVFRLIPGSYGTVSGVNATIRLPGMEVFDPIAKLKFFDYPTTTSGPSAFSTPLDLSGRYALGLDYRGIPFFEGVNEPYRGAENSPYELNLSRSAVRGGFDTSDASDTPFSAAELERVLRAYDADAVALPERLTQLWKEVFQPGGRTPFLKANRRIVTTDSFDLPVPNVTTTEELRRDYGLEFPRHIAELLVTRLAAAGLDEWQVNGEPFIDQNGDGVYDPSIDSWNVATDDRNSNGVYDPGQLEKLLGADLLMGLRMDVNRPFGNGRDDPVSPNGIVDEPNEASREFMDLNDDNQFDPAVDVPMYLSNGIDVNGDGKLNGIDQSLSRQLFARHLYVLAMLLANAQTDPSGLGYLIPLDPRELSNRPPSGDERRKLTARRFAQWAINVVDFRDADAIMSPFEYDINPFNSWQVDGDLATDEGAERAVVWGCEYPHLLLTETCAFHDTRLVDSDQDDGSGKPRGDTPDSDDDLDQFGVPQGSFFAELYCTGNSHNPAMPQELYSYIASLQRWELDLARTAGGASKDGFIHPVWRLAISYGHPQEANSVLERLLKQPETTTLETNMPGDLTTDFTLFGNEEIDIERIVWFISTSPYSDPLRPATFADRTYFNMGPVATPRVAPGHYAVVGPRAQTRIGNKSDGSQSNHVIELDPVGGVRQVAVARHDGNHEPAYLPARPEIQPPVAIIAGAHRGDEWINAPMASRYNGVNISEPLFRSGNYYPKTADDSEVYQRIRDTPLDHVLRDRPLSVEEDNLLGEGTRENYKTVFLQRLANPLLPWNPLPGHVGHEATLPVNPYITIDWMPVDLTVFNGTDHEPSGWALMDTDQPWNSPNSFANDEDFKFRTRERKIRDLTMPKYINLWRTDSFFNQNDSVPHPGAQNHFPMNLDHTLGYLNDNAESINANNDDGIPLRHRPLGRAEVPDSVFVGDPRDPFPWLTWNDRPFISQYELMMVPSSSPSRLLFEYTMSNKAPDPIAPREHPYEADGQTDQEKFEGFRAPYRHLFNFFQSSGNINTAAHFYRLLEYTHVPSRFVGTETLLNPREFVAGPGTETFHPPFNKVSTYRDPGKVNINTITSERLWQGGIAHRVVEKRNRAWNPNPNDPVYYNPYDVPTGHGGPTWRGTSNNPGVIDTRRGYAGANIVERNDAIPTFFANPLRSPDAGSLVPLASMRRRGVDCTLLRNNEDLMDPQPLFAASSNQPFDHTDRNPYFRYQSIQRLANLLTTRSNVYAVWITVGFFEVQPAAGLGGNPLISRYEADERDYVYPDGYMLGPEVGSDVGDVKRHRAFYIIDRSIPVAYEPGKNHNVENTILLKRFIE